MAPVYLLHNLSPETHISNDGVFTIKVLLISNGNPFGTKSTGGMEQSLALLGAKLAARGHQVSLIAADVELTPAGKCAIEAVGYRPYRYLALSGILRPFRRMNSLFMAYTIRQTIKSTRPDIVYASYDDVVLRGLLLATGMKFRHRPIFVLRMAGEFWHVLCTKKPKLVGFFETAFNLFDSINFISPTVRMRTHELFNQYAMNIKLPHEKCLDIGVTGAAPAARTRLRKKASQQGDVLNIAFVARFATYSKRQDLLIKALAASDILSKGTAYVNFFGDGPAQDEMEQLATTLGVFSHCKFHGSIPHNTLLEELGTMDLLCLFSDHEGGSPPKAALEAMANGVPVMLSDIAPNRLAIQDRGTGFLVSNDPLTIAKTLEEIIRDRSLLGNVATNALEVFNECYNADKQAILFEEYFKELQEKQARAKN